MCIKILFPTLLVLSTMNISPAETKSLPKILSKLNKLDKKIDRIGNNVKDIKKELGKSINIIHLLSSHSCFLSPQILKVIA